MASADRRAETPCPAACGHGVSSSPVVSGALTTWLASVGSAAIPTCRAWVVAARALTIGRAVLAAAAGQAVLDPAVQQRLLSAAVRAPAAAPGALEEGDLTPRESDVLRLIAAGKSNREIARALFVSEATVKTPSTGSSPRPARGTAVRPCATPIPTAMPTRRTSANPARSVRAVHLAWLLVDPQAAPARLAQDPVGGPFGERDLADQPGFHPPGIVGGLGRNLSTERARVTPQRRPPRSATISPSRITGVLTRSASTASSG